MSEQQENAFPVILGLEIKGRRKIILDYLVYTPPNSRVRLRAMQLIVGLSFLYLGAKITVIALTILEILNFIIWYKKERT